MITIIDYGLGNIRAFLNVYKRLNIPATSARTAQELEGATRLILPGVGSFDHAMNLLAQSGMRTLLDEMVLNRSIPVLGVCVGMQILAKSSEEGKLPGLSWIDGTVRKLHATNSEPKLRLPHMGWNDVRPVGLPALFAGLEQDARFYFLHSYYFSCANQNSVMAETEYGFPFSSAVLAKNIYGVQFHPEKSHLYGTRLLKNFAEI